MRFAEAEVAAKGSGRPDADVAEQRLGRDERRRNRGHLGGARDAGVRDRRPDPQHLVAGGAPDAIHARDALDVDEVVRVGEAGAEDEQQLRPAGVDVRVRGESCEQLRGRGKACRTVQLEGREGRSRRGHSGKLSVQLPSLSHSFSAPGAPADVFALLADPTRVVGCLPGATLEGAPPEGGLREGQELGGRIAVRLGPVGTQFRGVVRVLEFDSETRRTVLAVRAEEEKGNGSASATMSLVVEPEGGGSRVDVGAEVEIRGRVASFGAGAIERVSARLVEQFAANLAATIGGRGAASTPPGSPTETTATPQLGVGDLVPSGVWPVLATGFAFLCGVLVGGAIAKR